MANEVQLSASSILAVFGVLVTLVACMAEEKSIFLVLMEGEPVAFRGGHSSGKGSIFKMSSEVPKDNTRILALHHDQLLQSNLESGSYNKLCSFKHIVNGFAVYTTASQAKKLKVAPEVKLVEKDRGAKLMTMYTPQFLGLPKGVWAQEGGDKNAGNGIVIGFVDTGINPVHPSFAYNPLHPFAPNISHFSGACDAGPRFPASSCNGKIVSARFFSAGAEAVATLNTSVDFLSPFDAVGHGRYRTWKSVAVNTRKSTSTAAGNAGVPVLVNGFYYGRASGMAPRARIAVYKAVYPTVGTLTDVIAAIDQAALDGVDILTLSVGPDEPPEDSLTFLSVFEIAILYARRAGIFVVQAAGNHGPDLYSVVSYSPWAVGVAACTTDRSYPSTLLLGNGQRIGGVGLSGRSFGDGLFSYELVFARDAVKVNGTFPRTPEYVEECQYPEALDPKLVRGRIVVCVFSAGFYNGTSTIFAITDTARALGFEGFAFVANPVYGDFIAEAIPFSMPGIMIPRVSDTQVISEYYEQHIQRDASGLVIEFCARAATRDGRMAIFQGRAPTVSRFSSRGPDFSDIDRHPADVLKPDILAPGHQIWAAWSPLSVLEPILEGYDFALLSGTSMATPHIAGIAALIKQYNPSWSPSVIASAIQTTASKYNNYGEIILAEGANIDSFYPSTHFDLGAGLVNPNRAIDPGLALSSEFEDYLSFLCSLPNTDWTAVRAATGVPCSQSLSHPANLNLPSVTISELRGSQIVLRRVENVGSKPETYLCAVASPNGTAVSISPSQFAIAPRGIQDVEIKFQVIQAVGEFSFGEIVLTGSLGHIVRIPLSVLPLSVYILNGK